MLHSVLVDKSYSAIANHVDEQTKKKIINNEYVEFAKLIPKNKFRRLEDESSGLQQVVSKGGYMYCLQLGKHKDMSGADTILNFAKWTRPSEFSHTSTLGPTLIGQPKLMQYSHTIHDAAQSFLWENVYAYDRDFRHHLSQKIGRSWGVILNQAWTFYMRERSIYSMHGSGSNVQRGTPGRPKRDMCWTYQTGKCTYGISCKYEHKCAE